jgi:NitT/TauT family transport system ATP-binding protein
MGQRANGGKLMVRDHVSAPTLPDDVVDDGAGSSAVDVNGMWSTFARADGGEPFTALRDVSLTFSAGKFVSVVGPTGCGKSTLLTAISGLRAPSRGSIEIGGGPVRSVRRDVGFVFQQDALLPWRTALQNVALPLRFRGVKKAEARERASEWLNRVGLSKFERSYPHQLSGGMRKRVAIAATLVYQPNVLLMDEPFSALDVQTRNIMEDDLLRVWEQAGHQTVIFVTHDLEEAIGLSDRVIVLSAGPGHVIGDYQVPFERPRNLLEVKLEPAFIELYKQIWRDLEGEVRKAHTAHHIQRTRPISDEQAL